MVQHNTVQHNTIQYTTKIRPHKFLFDPSAGIAELVGVFSIPSWVFRVVFLNIGNLMSVRWQKSPRSACEFSSLSCAKLNSAASRKSLSSHS